ncbi:hypothetical protein MRX96_036506 [Rhipicephalus microplus]
MTAPTISLRGSVLSLTKRLARNEAFPWHSRTERLVAPESPNLPVGTNEALYACSLRKTARTPTCVIHVRSRVFDGRLSNGTGLQGRTSLSGVALLPRGGSFWRLCPRGRFARSASVATGTPATTGEGFCGLPGRAEGGTASQACRCTALRSTPFGTLYHVSHADSRDTVSRSDFRGDSQEVRACKRKEDAPGGAGAAGPASKSQPKKPRLVFTDLQRRTLQAIFKETKRPSKEMQITISQQLGLELSTVGNFFMNARRRSQDKWQDEADKGAKGNST